MVILNKDTARHAAGGSPGAEGERDKTVDLPLPAAEGEAAQPEPGAGLLGAVLDGVRIVDFLDKGGMGEVYVGYDERLKRRVALKALRSGLRRQPEARARFLHEARVLSQFEHPHICRIYDLIEGGEQDFLVLELIQGTSLRKAIETGLGRPLKLRIARQVAQVLAAAHERGFVHRDLKPDNVMLTPEGDAKVLDFGLARLVQDPAAETVSAPTGGAATAHEVAGSMICAATSDGTVAGTLGYMSPEQARGELPTPASDMYSYGLLLQELFSGLPPVEAGDSVLETLTRTERGETRAFSDPDKDLVALVNRLKSLAPASRPSALDVEERLRWVAGKPRRRRVRILAAAAAAALAVTAAVAVVQAVRAHREAERASREAETARQVSDFLEGMFEVADPNEAMGRTVTAREILDRGARKVESELRGQPLVQARLMGSIGRVYTELGLYDEAVPLLEGALDIRRKNLGNGAPDVGQSCRDLGYVRCRKNDYVSGEKLIREALRIHEAALGPEDPEVARDLIELANLLGEGGRFKEAEPLFERALRIREKAFGPDSREAALVWNDLAVMRWLQGDYTGAEPLMRRALAIQEKALGPDHPELGSGFNNLALLLRDEGEFEAARPLFERALAIDERALGPEHPNVAVVLNNLGSLLFQAGQLAQARPILERALAVSEKTLGPDHPDVANKRINLGNLLFDEGELEAAWPLLEGTDRIYEKAYGPDHPRVAVALACQGKVLTQIGGGRAGQPLLERSLRITERAFGPEDQQVAWPLNLLASNLIRQGRHREAGPLCERAIAVSEKRLGASPGDRPVQADLARSLILLGSVRRAAGDAAGADKAWTEAADLLGPMVGGTSTIYARDYYVRVHCLLGRGEQAREVAGQLFALGYRAPGFVELCRRNGLIE